MSDRGEFTDLEGRAAGWALPVALVLFALVLLLGVRGAQPPPVKGSDIPAHEFSGERALAVLRELLREGVPHPVGTPANERVRDRILSHLRSLGYDTVYVQETYACADSWDVCARVQNIVTRLRGQHSRPAVMVAAHYDSEGAGAGAGDDGAGVATALEIARVLRREGPPRNDVIFLIDDGEEPGMLGARAFVRDHPWSRDVAVVVNIEGRGSAGPSMMFETSDGNGWLIETFAASAARPHGSSVMYEAYRRLPNDTDLSVFKRAGMAGFNFAFIGNVEHYHTGLDDIGHLDPRSLQHHGDNALPLVRRLAHSDLTHARGDNAVYSDIAGRLLLRWPERWAVPLAILILGVLATVTAVLLRRRAITYRGLVRASGMWLLTLLGSGLVGIALISVLRLITGDDVPWYAHPAPARAALWFGTLLVGSSLAYWTGRRTGFIAILLAVWLWWSVLGLIFAVAVPGVSALFLPPTVVAAVGIGLAAFARPRYTRAAMHGTCILAAVAAASFWLLFVLRSETAFGLAASTVTTVPLALLMTTVAPLFAVVRELRRTIRVAVTATSVALLGLVYFAARVDTYSAFKPQRFNLRFYQDGDSAIARWIAPDGLTARDVPLSLRAYLNPVPAHVQAWDEPARRRFFAPARPIATPTPDLIRLSEERRGGTRLVRTVLRSRRGATTAFIFAPRDRVAAVRIEGQQVAPLLRSVSPITLSNLREISIHGLPPEGVRVDFELEGDQPAELLIVDATQGLPPSGADLVRARNQRATVSKAGDLSLVLTRVRL